MGARIEASDDSGTPLRHAAKGGHEATVRLLLDRGASIEAWECGSRNTPLGEAPPESGHEATVRLLLDRGANIEAREDYSGRTPLGQAAMGGHEAVVRLLLNRGANAKARDKLGKTLANHEQGYHAVVNASAIGTFLSAVISTIV